MEGLAGMMGMMGMGRATEAASEYPEEYAMLQGDRTKQMLAQLLLARGMQQQPPGQMAGRFYVPNSPLQGIAGLAQAGAGAYLMNANDQKRMEMAKALQARRQGEVDQFQKQLAPQQMQVPAQGPGAPVVTPQGADALQSADQGLVPAGSPLSQEILQRQEPLYTEGPQPMTTQEVPRSKEEVKQALMQAIVSNNQRLREAAKFMAQQQQAEEQKALDRESTLEGRKLGMSQAIMTATMMGASKEQIENIKATLAQQLEDVKQSGQDRRDNVQGSVVADPKSPTGYSYADLRTGKIVMPGAPVPASAVQQEKNAGAGEKLSPTAQKELIQTDEEIEAGQAAVKSLDQALGVNDEAMGFTGAGAVASVGSVLPESLRPKAVDATVSLDNMVMGSALPQLKQIFGGNPTEGERKILLEMQGSSSKTPAQRKDIFDRAKKAVERRIQFNTQKSQQLRDGTYFKPQGAAVHATVSSDADYDKLPSGAMFVGPDGKTRKKP